MAEDNFFDETPVNDAPSGYVRVSVLGGNESLVPIGGGGASVAQCLQRAGVDIPLAQGQTASVNGEKVGDLFSTRVSGDEIIVVAGNIANGENK